MGADWQRSLWLWLAAALLPCVAAAASLVVNVEPGEWATLTAGGRRGLAADALLYIAGALIVAAPIAGVAASSGGRAAGGIAASLSGAVVSFATASAVMTLIGWGQVDDAARTFVATSHITLAAVGLALVAFGALCGVVFGDALDAAAVSLSTVLIAAGGLLVAGAAVGDLPRHVIHGLMTASPLIVITAAAEIDIVRMGLPYQISPLAHLQVDYPTWHIACGSYLAVAALCFVGVSRRVRTWSITPAERMTA